MGELKARLRAWLIDLVREAIRLEAKQALGLAGIEYTHKPVSSGVLEAIKRPVPPADPSFEQMQAQSIAQQEKYYAPLNP